MWWGRRRACGDDGASALEYTGLLVLGGLILGTLFVTVPNPARTHARAALCRILHPGGPCPAGAKPRPGRTCTAFCPTRQNPIHPSSPQTAATKGDYVGLGDSYASGEGANGGGQYLPGSGKNGCHRAAAAYSKGLTRQFRYQGGSPKFVACSGATTTDLVNGKNGEPSQLNALNDKTTTVTLSVGGDDLEFAKVIRTCLTDPHHEGGIANPSGQDACVAQNDSIETNMRHLFGHPPNPSRYQRTLERIHERAPNARILVAGYPHLFPDPPEAGYGQLHRKGQRFLNDKARELNANIQRQVQELDSKWYGDGTKKMGSFEYVDTWDALNGHEIGTGDPWINGLKFCEPGKTKNNPNCSGLWPPNQTSSFHPNTRGQKAYQRAYARQIQEGPGRVLYDP